MKPAPKSYPGYRYPTEIISHAAYLYFRFSLRYRDVEEILAARSIVVSYEAFRCLSIAMLLHQDIQDITILVDGTENSRFKSPFTSLTKVSLGRRTAINYPRCGIGLDWGS